MDSSSDNDLTVILHEYTKSRLFGLMPFNPSALGASGAKAPEASGTPQGPGGDGARRRLGEPYIPYGYASTLALPAHELAGLDTRGARTQSSPASAIKITSQGPECPSL